MSGPLVAAPAPASLQLFALCTPFVVAMAADAIDRLLLPQEAQLIGMPAPPALPASLGILAVEGRHYSAWDLGVLLGLPPQDEAFVLMRAAAKGTEPPMALRTGSCLSVAPLRATNAVALSPTLFRTRRGAFTTAFGAASFRGGREDIAPIGLALDVERLWSEEELQHARTALRTVDSQAS